MDLTFWIITYFSIGSTLIPTFLGLIKPNLGSVELRFLTLLSGISFVCDVAQLFLSNGEIKNLVGNAYVLVEFALLFLLYYRAYRRPGLFRIFLPVGLLFLLIFSLNLYFLPQEKQNAYSSIYSSLVFIVFSASFFYQLMKYLPTAKLWSLPMFWINSAVLIYFSGNLFLFTLTHYLVHILNDNLVVYWGFHNLLNIIKNILFAAGFYVSIKVPKDPL